MCNIIPKILNEKKSKNIEEIRNDLKRNFKIEISEEAVDEILGELEERNIAMQDNKGWLKIRP